MPINTIRLSLSALFFICVLLLCVAVGGGIISSRLFTTPLPLQTDSNGTIVPISQQITVSPSKLASDIVATHGKSIFLLAHENAKGITALGTGVTLTNDGIIMSLADTKEEGVVAVGEDGIIFPLTSIGRDELSGISFYKTSDKIVTPFTISQNTPLVGSSFLALYRQGDSAQITAHPTTFATTIFPPETAAPGIQKLALIASNSPTPQGAALLDENGNLTGVILHTVNNTALFVSDIRSALDRLSSQQLNFNPFTPLGFTLQWKTLTDTNRTLHTKSVVSTVRKNSPADIAGLEAGDTLTAIAGNTVSWDTDIVSALSAKPLNLTIVRNEEQRQISINP